MCIVLNDLQFFSFLFSVSGQELYELTGSYSYTLHRILCSHGVDTSLGLQQLFQSTKQCSASGQNDTALCNIRSQLWWCALQYAVYSFHDLCSCLFESFLCLLRRNSYCLRKPSHR